MCTYVKPLNKTCQSDELYCTSCALARDRFRLVKRCWYPGCVKDCSHFDCHCIPKDATSNDKNKLTKNASELEANILHKIISHVPGRCFKCSGSGLAEEAKEKSCPICHGDGECQDCHGHFKKHYSELKQSEIPREW